MQTVETLAERIATHPFVRDVSPCHLAALAACAMEGSFDPNETIFREGDLANRFYLIESGRVQLEALNGVAIPIQKIGSGDVLGWSWLFPPFIWQFTATAIEPTRAIFLYGSRVRELCELDKTLGYSLMRAVASVTVDRLQAVRRELAKRSDSDDPPRARPLFF